MSTPFWDLDFAVDELERCIANGHKAVNFCNHPESHGEPPLSDPHWDRLWAAAQEADVPISFHIGGGDITAAFTNDPHLSFQAKFPKVSALMIMDNIETLADLIFGGVCHRFPELRFVSVESGVGWMPSVPRHLIGSGATTAIRQAHPGYDLLPSEYFRRQIYGCFWFEEHAAACGRSSASLTTSSSRPTSRTPRASIPDQPALGRLPASMQRRRSRVSPIASSPRSCTTTQRRSTASPDRPPISRFLRASR